MQTQVDLGAAPASWRDFKPETTHELTIAVVGIGYPNKDGSDRRFVIAMLDPGAPVALKREPDRALWLCSKLANGLEITAIYQEAAATAAYVRVRIGGGTPTLPGSGGSFDPQAVFRPRPPRPAISADGFYPDPDGPEFGA